MRATRVIFAFFRLLSAVSRPKIGHHVEIFADGSVAAIFAFGVDDAWLYHLEEGHRLRNQGRYLDAVGSYRRALQEAESLGSDQKAIATARNSLGVAYLLLQKSRLAEAEFRLLSGRLRGCSAWKTRKCPCSAQSRHGVAPPETSSGSGRGKPRGDDNPGGCVRSRSSRCRNKPDQPRGVTLADFAMQGGGGFVRPCTESRGIDFCSRTCIFVGRPSQSRTCTSVSGRSSGGAAPVRARAGTTREYIARRSSGCCEKPIRLQQRSREDWPT